MKTLVLILDALNYSDLGEMPFLDELRSKGAKTGKLDCGFKGEKGYFGQGHTVSSSGALATGKTPTSNGKFVNRFRWDVRGNKISTHRELDTKEFLWDIIDEEGIKSLIVNYPILYPPEKLENGTTISGILAPQGGRFASPKKTETELREGNYTGDISAHFGSNKPEGWSYIQKGDMGGGGEYITDLDKSTLSDEEIRDFAFSMVYNRTEAVMNLCEEHSPEFCLVWYGAPDRLKHHLSSFENPGELLTQLLRDLDKNIKELVEQEEPENLIVFSDHGFGKPVWEENHHRRHGFYLIKSDLTWLGKEENHILDMFPTILATLGISVPKYCEGVKLLQPREDKENIKRRLTSMGYGKRDPDQLRGD